MRAFRNFDSSFNVLNDTKQSNRRMMLKTIGESFNSRVSSDTRADLFNMIGASFRNQNLFDPKYVHSNQNLE